MKGTLLTVLMATCLCTAASGQEYIDYILENRARAAATLHCYEYAPEKYTPAPKGYTPFYISHYGRHGARYHSKQSYLDKPITLLKQIDSAGFLNSKGKELLDQLLTIQSESKGMAGMLTEKGKRELYDIGRRMADNYPEIFGKDKEVYAASSYVPRCLISMTSFCDGLTSKTGELDISYHTGDRIYAYLCPENDKRKYRKLADEMKDRLAPAISDPHEFLAGICTDTDAATAIAGNPYSFVSDIWRACSISNATDAGENFFRFFSDDELIAQWILKNNHFYCQYGNSPEAATSVYERAYPIVEDIVLKADEALTSGRAADMRFGHDMWLVPLASYIGLEDFSASVPSETAHLHWNLTKNSQFASNLQMVFFRNKKSDILVKFLYNERETLINGLKPISGPYYRWSDVREHLLSQSPLHKGFKNPPMSARPQVWWHWMNGNITSDGLRKDIEWMHRIGLSGFHVFDAGINTPKIVDSRLEYMSDNWKTAFADAVRLADSLNMEVTIPSSPGWSSTGGPWVSPEDAMKKIVWREMNIGGGRRFKGTLPEPYTVSGKFQNIPVLAEHSHASGAISERYYTDVAVIAVKRPEADKDLVRLGAVITSSGGNFSLEQLTNGNLTDYGRLPAHESGHAWIQYEFPEPQTIRALSVVNENPRRRGHSIPAYCLDSLQVSDDGINFRTVFGIPVGDALRQTISFEGITARFFRLKHKNPKAYFHYSMGTPDPDPEYSEIAEFVIYPELRINHVEEKAAFAAGHDLALYPTCAAHDEDVSTAVIDITEFVKDGVLDWQVPEGEWTIYRFGASLTGKKNHPASPEATGLEVDKINPEAWRRYFRAYLDMYKDAADGLLGQRGIQYVLTDSYEAGHVNWSPRLFDEFRTRKGYDPEKWLPVLTGVIIGSTAESEKFLLDWRDVIGELFEENYANLTELVRKEYGMKGCFIEAHENGRCFVADGMAMKKTASYPMSAIWVPGKVGTPDRIPEGKADIRESASVANIYGQNIVTAESLTSIGYAQQAYSYCPENLKHTADIELSQGLNRFVIHESAHQPSDSHKPGVGLGVYGQWFNRHETWAEQAEAWIDYLSRSCFMLQQGRAVKDILWFYGEDNNITGLYSHSFPDIPEGYDFDFINPEALLEEISVKNGRLCSRTGMEYSVLCLDPNASDLSPTMLARVEELKSQGVRICGHESKEIACALMACGREPDWTYNGTDTLKVVHRKMSDGEIYWVNSPMAEHREAEVSFRVSGLKPQIWDPVSGEIRDVSYRINNGRTDIRLSFSPDDAYFIVFRGKAESDSLMIPQSSCKTLSVIDGEWKVIFEDSFNDKFISTFSSLHSWTEDSNSSIRFYSGSAVYTQRIAVPAHEGKVFLDLGDVRNIAEIFIDGQEVCTLWKRPFEADITDHVNGKSEVELSIKVTNLWVNRLIGDSAKESSERKSYTSKAFYKPDDPLLPSGLLGPVRLVEEF